MEFITETNEKVCQFKRFIFLHAAMQHVHVQVESKMLVWDMNNYSWFELIYSEWVCVFIVCAMKLCVVVNVCIQLTRVNVFRGCIWYLTSQYLHSVTMSFTGPEPEKDNQPLIIGVSVGIGIPVIVIIILLLCCCNRCYNKRKFFIHSSLINTCMLGMCGIYFFYFGSVLKKTLIRFAMS